MAPQKGYHPGSRRASHTPKRHGERSLATSAASFTPPTHEWLDFLAQLLARAARDAHPNRTVGTEPAQEMPGT
jgi:hypothetical protein